MRIISFIRNLFVNKPKMKLAHIDEKGTKYFFHNGECNCIIHSNGDEYWYLNDELHREDGPAIVTKTYQGWYKHGKIIREFGLAPKKGKEYIIIIPVKFTIKDGL